MGGASGAGGNSKWWCAPFGADAATGCDYLGAARPLEQVKNNQEEKKIKGKYQEYLGASSRSSGLGSYRAPAKVCPIQDDEDGHLSYKLGDIIENENFRCEE